MRTHSISSSNKKAPPYTVTLGGEDGDTCECKAFQFCLDEVPTCKHITEARRVEDEATAEDADREMGIDTSHKK